MNNYRFFEFKTKDFLDYCRADNLEHAKEIFKYYYPKLRGVVKETLMVDFNTKSKYYKNS